MLASVAMRHRLPDRRSADRPANGDTALCPKCGLGVIEFNERYRVPLATGKMASMPAWICDRPECRFERAARRSDREESPPPPEPARRRSPRALTTARAVLRRARTRLSRTLGRKRH